MRLFSNILEIEKEVEVFNFKGVDVIPFQLLNKENLRLETYDKLTQMNLSSASEISNLGSVNTINVRNLSDYYLILHDGEILEGAKQNRCLSKTSLIKPYSDKEIEVFCVEKGRWNYSSRYFRHSNHRISPKMRSRKNSNYGLNVQTDLQDIIWNEVDEISKKNNKHSPTKDFCSVIENINISELEELKKGLFKKKYNGLIVKGIENDFIEIFYNFSIYKNQVNKSLNSLSYNLLLREKNKDNYSVYIQTLKDSLWKREFQKDNIEAFITNQNNQFGRCIFYNKQLLHLIYHLN